MNNESDDKYLIENNFVFSNFMKYLVLFSLKVNVSKVFVKTHPRREILDTFFKENFIEMKHSFENGLHLINLLVYKRVIVHSLPKPYETECFDYGRKGFFSRSDCIDSCRKENERNISGKQWPGTYLNSDHNSEDRMNNVIQSFAENLDEDMRIGLICKEMCGLHSECYYESYEMDVQNSGLKWDTNIIPILSPDQSDLVYTIQPSMLFEEFLSYLGSYISFWFGFSALMLSDLLIHFSKKFNIKVMKPKSVLNQINIKVINVKPRKD